MTLATRIHFLTKDKDEFLKHLPIYWEMSEDPDHPAYPDRNLLICYLTDTELTFLKLKFDLIEYSGIEDVCNIP